ncbi:hypothetical protein KDAU_64990 [Dictyobacter aurantiacus]|uniref:Uncharacterized protein n=1 Tax=Dictyobacter aurantiacus TaxID=1936993 RepID=A0A401ZQU0_9CHLR|nr:hypothetical protein KDAU_64990 [Dictyobacter aurantiacus]
MKDIFVHMQGNVIGRHFDRWRCFRHLQCRVFLHKKTQLMTFWFRKRIEKSMDM